MQDGGSFRFSRRTRAFLPCAVVLIFWLAALGSASAQLHGVPPSVTSIQFHVPPFLPNAMPSVTSIGPYGIGYRPGAIPPPYGVPITRPFGHGRKGLYGFGYNAGAYIAPYYIPTYDTSYGYDGGGPYPYSGPPEQTLHLIVDMPPISVRHEREIEAEALAAAPPPAPPVPETQPLDATVLVFRDGHQEEVSNYAIMGQTLYIFGTRTQKIGLGDLDVPKTIKLNDDRGVDFHLPNPKQG